MWRGLWWGEETPRGLDSEPRSSTHIKVVRGRQVGVPSLNGGAVGEKSLIHDI